MSEGDEQGHASGLPAPGYAATSLPASVSVPVSAPAPGTPETGELTGESWDERIGALQALADRPLAEHVEAFDALHTELKRRLGEVDGQR